MNLTPAQIQTLKSGIAANATAAAFPNTSDGNFACAAFLNTQAAPTVNVWKTSVSEAMIKSGIGWQTFLGLTLQLQTAYIAMTQDGFIDATDKGTMHGLVGLAASPTDGIFPDTTPSSVAIRALCQRPATYFEAMFTAPGLGTLSTGNVCLLDAGGVSLYGQQVDYQTVSLARNS